MADFSLQYGAQGVQFIITIVDQNGAIVNLQTATGLLIKLGRPDGTSEDKTATLVTNGTDGQITYTTVANDLNQSGTWTIQGGATISGTPLPPTEVKTFYVYKNVDNVGI